MNNVLTQDHTQTAGVRSSGFFKALMLAGLMLAGVGLGGCRTASEGLFTGAAMGAMTGLAIGAGNDDAAEGAVLGAVIGGVAGSIIGDQNEDRRRGYRYDRGGYRHNDPCEDGYRGGEWWND